MDERREGRAKGRAGGKGVKAIYRESIDPCILFHFYIETITK